MLERYFSAPMDKALMNGIVAGKTKHARLIIMYVTDRFSVAVV